MEFSIFYKIMTTPEQILKDAISLRPLDQARLVEKIIAVLDSPNPDLDLLWADEAESRLEAYKSGKINSVSLESVLSKYK